MRIIKLIALSLAMMLSLNGIASAESTLNKILSSGAVSYTHLTLPTKA